MIVLLVLLTIVLTIYHFVTHYGRRGRLVNKIPGPTVRPLFGNVLEFMRPLSKN